MCFRRFKNNCVKFLELSNLRNEFYTKIPKMDLFKNLELVLSCIYLEFGVTA